jgi:PAS domain S-box-containing protein
VGALPQSTEMSALLFSLENAPDCYLFLSPDLTILGATDAYLRATLTNRASLVGRNVFEAFPENPQDHSSDQGVSALHGSLDRVRVTKKPDHMPTVQYDVPRPPNQGGGFAQKFWKAAHYPVLSRNGELLYIIHRTEDVTETVQRELASESALQFRLLVEGVTDYAIYMLDPQGHVASWNAGAARIKGYSADEILGQHFSRFYSAEEVKSNAPARALETAMREGRFEKESYRLRKDGTKFLAHVIIDPIRDDSGNVIGFAKITRDITEREENRKALERTREQLFQSQKVEAIGKLTGGVAHDFNNLLMVIQSSLELLRKRTPDNAQITPLIQNALRATERGTALTHRMLAFARKQDIEKRVIQVPQLIRDVSDLLKRSLGPSYEIDCDFEETVAHVLADPNQLESALLNLAFNARDAMPNGGKITISVRLACSPSSDLPAGDYVSIALKDEGHGMDAETLRQATDPFFTTKGVGKGTGLGLSMVQGMAEQSGGSFRLSSRRREGTNAEILLPAAKAALATGTEKRDEKTATSHALVIIAVDDDGLVLMNTTAMLEDLGHSVLEANSAREALELLHSTKVDLVITDHAMPGTTGLQLAKMIREEKPDLPILLATGYAEIDPSAGIQLPRIGKPFLQDDLKLAIDKVMLRG